MLSVTKAKNIISPDKPIEKGDLFLMIPKLYKLYNPKSQEPRSRVYLSSIGVVPNSLDFPNDQLARDQVISQPNISEEELTFDLEKLSTLPALSSDCFVFRMMQGAVRTSTSKNGKNLDSKSHSNAARRWLSVKNEIINHGLTIIGQGALAKKLFAHRTLIVDSLEKIIRISLRVETKMYQKGIVLKQILLEDIHSVGAKIQNFFKILTESVPFHDQFFEVLCVSPDDLNTLCKLESPDKLAKAQSKLKEKRHLISIEEVESPMSEGKIDVRKNEAGQISLGSIKIQEERYSLLTRSSLINEDKDSEVKISLIPVNPYHSLTKIPDSSEFIFVVPGKKLENPVDEVSKSYQKPDEFPNLLKFNHGFAVKGPHCYVDSPDLNRIKPLQKDMDDDSDLMNESFGCQPNKKEQDAEDPGTPKIDMKKQAATRAELISLENEVRYLRSLLNPYFNNDRMEFITQLLTKHFLKTPKTSSAGRTSSFTSEKKLKTFPYGSKTLLPYEESSVREGSDLCRFEVNR
jgi:hypothetical protein